MTILGLDDRKQLSRRISEAFITWFASWPFRP